MIVKNEADCLGACLESVRGIADEIVVCDTGSTDDTPAIPGRFGASVHAIPWDNDFAQARNHSIAAATGDWLLHMDADEVLGPEGAARVRALVDADGDGADAIEVTLANYCDDPRAWRWVPVAPDDAHARGHAGYIAVGLLRLFRAGQGYEYREAVHENITQSVLERGGRIRAENIVIHHHGYAPEGAKREAKNRLYLEIARKKRDANPHDPKCLHDWAEQALACGLTGEAEAACRAALTIEPLNQAAGMTLANILLNRGDLDEARGLLEALDSAGLAPPLAGVALGSIALRQGRLEEAETRLDAALALEPRQPMARLYRARLYDLRDQPERALEELRFARDAAPQAEEFRARFHAHEMRGQGERLFQAGRKEQALACLVEALRRDPEDPLIHHGLGTILEALGQDGKAKACYERARRLAPSMQCRTGD